MYPDIQNNVTDINSLLACIYMQLLGHKRNKPVSEFVDNNFALDRKIREALAGVQPSVQWSLQELPRAEDKELIADFILNYPNESEDGMPMSANTKRAYISALVYLSRFHDHKKSFKQMTRADIVDGYLNSLKRDYSVDPDQKWVNTYNNRATKYMAFWKWLTQPDVRREERQLPPQLKGLRFAKRKNKTHVKREDFWTPQEHLVFMNYCEDLRLACYHAIARETGGRPGELLALKINDLKIQTSPSTGKKYAELWIGRTGKMKKGRPVTISDAIPYYNTWVHVHPKRDNPEQAYLFPSRENKAKYRNKALVPDSLRQAYTRTIEELFPQLLERGDVPLQDKAALKSLIYDKPHFPYLLRHEFASEYAPKLSRLSFNQLMGHSESSKMQDVYVQSLGNEGNTELQIMRGIRTREDTLSPVQAQLQPKYCPICKEANKQTADFCFKCNWIISKKGVEQVKEKDEATAKEAEQTKQELAELKAKQEILQANTASVLNALMATEMGVKSPEVKIITWRSDEGQESLFDAAAIARAENEAREKEHQQKHHKQK